MVRLMILTENLSVLAKMMIMMMIMMVLLIISVYTFND